jgi:hypothetical protein
MGIGASLVLIAVGAILRFATTTSVTGFNIQTIGLILIIVGAVGFLISLVFWSSWGGFGGWNVGAGYSRHRTTVRSGPAPRDPIAEARDNQPRTVVTRVEEDDVP